MIIVGWASTGKIRRICVVVWMFLFGFGFSQSGLRQSLVMTPDGEWRILWQSEPGQRYTLQRSDNLIDWEDVTTLTAVDVTSSYIDSAVQGLPSMLWRVVGPDGFASDPIKVSEVAPTLASSGISGSTSLGVVIDAEEPIATVKYFNGNEELGEAVPTLGGGWVFPVPWDRSSPRVAQVSVEATTVSGMTVRTPTSGILVADPSKFIALQPKAAPQVKEGFVSQSGAFIEADATGALGPFLYYPEGAGDPERTTGAHFAFVEGATIIEEAGATLIEFAEADFHRGALDENPIPSRSGLHTLDIENVVSAWVEDHFAVATGERVQLLWGDTEVAWENGALGVNGWVELQVTPPIGDFALPAFQTNVRISTDPESGERFLVVCFHGEWAPLPGSDMTFRIPQADPLKVYLSSRGTIEAQGTLEVVFPDGAEVRGSVSWRDPNFEVSLEGRGFTIPAVGFLRDQIPVDPLANFPTGTSEAELDELSDRLFAYRNIYRNVALSGLKHAEVDDLTEYTPPAAPAEGAGSVLEGWAWRVRSWGSDNGGELLEPAAADELQEMIAGAAKTAEASHNLPTALKLLRDYLILKGGMDGVVEANGPVAESIEEAEGRFFGAVERLMSQAASLDHDPASFAASVALLEQVNAAAEAATPASQGNAILAAEGDTPQLRANSLYGLAGEKIGVAFFVDGQRVFLSSMSPGEILGFLRILRTYRMVISQQPPSQQRAADLAILEQGRDEARAAFFQAQNTLAGNQIQTGDYDGLFQNLEDRVQFLQLMEALDDRILASSTNFNPTTATVLDKMLDIRALRPLNARALDCGRFDKIVRMIAYGGGSFLLDEALNRAQESVESCLNQQHGACGLLEQQLGTPEVDWSAAEFGSFSGKYESIENPDAGWGALTAYRTLQINQGGRYIKGRVQEQRGDHQTRFAFEGLLKAVGTEQGSPFVEFAVRLQRESTGAGGEFPPSVGTLRVREEGDEFFLRLDSGDVNSSEYGRVSRAPVFSDSIVATFSPSFRTAVEAAHFHPLHSKIAGEIVRRVEDVRTEAEIAQDMTNGMPNPKGFQEAIKLYYFPVGESSNFFANKVNALIGAILGNPNNPDPIRTGGIITKGQEPVVRLLITQALERNTDMFQRTGLVDNSELNERTFWVALNTLWLFADSGLDLSHIERLTGTPREEFASGETYHYTFSIEQKAVGGVIVGGASLDVKILKEYPPDQNKDPETFEYEGHLFGFSPGRGGGVIVGTTTSDRIPSPLNYTEDHLAGEVEFGQLSATLAIGGEGRTIGGNTFTFEGNGQLPSITFWTFSALDPVQGLGFGAGLDAWTGRIVPVGNENLGTAAVQFTASGHPDLPDAVFFDIGQPTLTDCGLQALRMFAAEHRALVASVGAQIEIEGFTDRTGTAASNLTLSQGRAQNVKAALIEIMGTGLKIPPDDILAFGRGEEQAAADGIPDDPSPQSNNQLYRRTEIRVSGLVRATVQAD